MHHGNLRPYSPERQNSNVYDPLCFSLETWQFALKPSLLLCTLRVHEVFWQWIIRRLSLNEDPFLCKGLGPHSQGHAFTVSLNRTINDRFYDFYSMARSYFIHNKWKLTKATHSSLCTYSMAHWIWKWARPRKESNISAREPSSCSWIHNVKQ